MNDIEKELYNDLLNESNFIENITFTDATHSKNENFKETLAYVKSLKSSWNISNNFTESQKNTTIHDSLVVRTQRPNAEVANNVSKLQPSICSSRMITPKTIPKCIANSQKTELKRWGLPPEIVAKYHSKGVKNMFRWQVECLGNSKVLNENGNLVYSAPTSAGKTLIAEILTIKTVLERQKKVMIILPFVSVVREKMFYFQDIFSDSGIRVEGFMGSHAPPGGFQAIHVAICTIEKANSLINNLLENGTISDLGAVVVDELHLLGDPHRGYILELLLTKLLYVTKRYEQIDIQIIGMSATLPNLSLLSEWLNADLYKTDFRPIPLEERYHLSGCIYNSKTELIKKIEPSEELPNDKDNIVYLCLETIVENCSVLIFCPTKNWCENLAQQIAGSFKSLGYSKSNYGKYLREQLDGSAISEVLEQLKSSPAGLDHVLFQTISFGVAFHHAGLTMDERDIIEGAFKTNAIRVLVSTSTLSSGVNLPARRVIVRSPTFLSKPISSLTYKQMVGRAGRTGIDTAGESILMCSANDKRVAEELISGTFDPISSCLRGGDKLLRAVLEAIASQVAKTPEDVQLFINCTLLLNSLEEDESMEEYSEDTIKQLVDYELVRLQNTCDELFYIATPLGKACLASSMAPQDGLILFKELQKARECFVLETDLHMIYLVTPYSICSQWGDLNWMHLLNLWDGLSKAMKRVGEMVGIQESLIYRCMRGSVKMNSPAIQSKLQVLRRFYTALALQDLINEVPLSIVSTNFNCSRGMLQSLQQSAATFAGMVTAFSRELGWKTFETLVSQFQDRLQFGIQSELLDLMRLQSLNGLRARALYNSGIETVCLLANADVCVIENALHTAVPFQSEKERDGEIKYDVEKRNLLKNIWITGKKGVTAKEASALLIIEARTYLQYELGVTDMKWQLKSTTSLSQHSDSAYSTTSPQHSDVGTAVDPKFDQFINNNIREMETPSPKLTREDMSLKLKKNNSYIHNDFTLNHSTPISENILKNGASMNDQPEGDTNNTSLNNHSDVMFKDLSNENIVLDSSDICEVECNTIKQNVSVPSLRGLSFTADITCKSSDCSIFQSDHSKNLSLFEDSIEIDTQLCGLLDKNQSGIKNSKFDKENTTLPNEVKDELKFTNNILSFEKAFDVPFDESIADKIFASQKLNCTGDVILSSQEKSEMDISLRNTKIVTPKRKLERIDKRKKKRRQYSPNYRDTNTISRKLNLINICNNQLSVTENDDIFSFHYILNQIKKGDYKKFEIPEPFSEIGNTVTDVRVYAVNACESVSTFEEYCSHILSFQTVTVYIDTEKSENTKNIQIGHNILNKNAHAHQNTNKSIKTYLGRCVIGFVIFIECGVAYYFDLQHKMTAVCQSDILVFFKTLVNDKNKKIILHNCKYGFLTLYRCCNIKIECSWEDPSVADWLLDPEDDLKSLPKLLEAYCSINLTSALTDKETKDKACLKAWATYFSLKTIKSIIEEKHHAMINTFGKEMKALKVIAQCEVCGIEIDKNMAGEILQRVKATQVMLEKHAFKLTGRRFRFSSPSEVAKILGLYKGHRVSTNKRALEKIDNPLAQIVIYWRKLSAILSKNLFPLTAKAVENTTETRIYGSYWTHTSTGRMSMQEPNLQSVPRNFKIPPQLLLHQIDDCEDKSTFFSCRRLFRSAPGTVLMSADYCQLELRILTHLSNDATLKKIVTSEEDIFKSIAATWKCISEDEVDDDLRQKTKQMCYGIIYGMGCKTLAQTLDICELEAVVFMNSFHAVYPSIKVYTNRVIDECKRLGYVETLSGRRRYFPLINSPRFSEKSHAERQAVNTTIQGSAADILKSAMISIHEILEESSDGTSSVKLVLLLHDELMYEVSVEKIDYFKPILRTCMETAVSLSVPLPVKMKLGKLWGDLEEVV